MPTVVTQIERWLFASDPTGTQSPGRLGPRWLFFRGFGLICFSAFHALLYQAPGLIGPNGLLPAVYYLGAVKEGVGPGLARFWYAPTLFWLRSGDHALVVLAWIGIVASLLLVLNIWPRLMVAICLLAFLSFVSSLQAFAAYQSDSMLLDALFVSLFFAPPGLRPGFGERHPPSRASLFLLQWLWFTIYFESGLVKILSGDPEWRWPLTAMDEYYQNGPLPTWIGWHAQHLPHRFHVGTAAATLGIELGLCWLLFLPRPFRLALFCIVTPLQIGIILTANYAFLNYLVLLLGILLLDDKYLSFCLPKRLRQSGVPGAAAERQAENPEPRDAGSWEAVPIRAGVRRAWSTVGLILATVCLSWVFYATAARLVWMLLPGFPIPQGPVEALQPFRIADSYGLFAVMTRGRYEIEFQGSNDGTHWVAYPFCYKPQDPSKAPGIYAPYQPRFDWNLWFASLDDWQSNRFVLNTEERLLEGSPEVLRLFCGDPFGGAPPHQTRAILWQYWFTDKDEKRQGLWWRRTLIGLYAPAVQPTADGRFAILAMPEGRVLERRQ